MPATTVHGRKPWGLTLETRPLKSNPSVYKLVEQAGVGVDPAFPHPQALPPPKLPPVIPHLPAQEHPT